MASKKINNKCLWESIGSILLLRDMGSEMIHSKVQITSLQKCIKGNFCLVEYFVLMFINTLIDEKFEKEMFHPYGLMWLTLLLSATVSTFSIFY